MIFTLEVESISKELDIPNSIAMDIYYIRQLEKRIIKAFRLNPKLREFSVYNEELEFELSD